MLDPRDSQADRDDQLIVRYLDGQLDEQAFAELNGRLKEDPGLRNRFIDMTMQAHHLQALVGKPDLGLVQDELLHIKPGGMRLQLPTHYKIGMAAALAAVLGLVASLVVVLSGSGQDGASPSGARAGSDWPSLPVYVATLTDQHEAEWAGPDPLVGALFEPGQRLELISGLAEITTKRGAVTILQAPATIELLDNGNAIYLHAGKLVGICETRSSKGFLVQTPHMDITDLGTRFGLDVTDAGLASTVFAGEVRLHNEEGFNQPLTAHQTARVSADDPGAAVVIEDRLAQGFASLRASPMYADIAWLGPRIKSGAIEWGGQVPADLRNDHHVSDNVQVYFERHGVLLEQDLSVDLNPDVPVYQDHLPPAKVAAGERVDVYLLHFDMMNQVSVRNDGLSLQFDRPILGVITSGVRLYETDALLGQPYSRWPQETIPYLREGRGLDRDNESTVDELSIDGQTLRMDLGLNDGGYFDQVRVLVQSEQP